MKCRKGFSLALAAVGCWSGMVWVAGAQQQTPPLEVKQWKEGIYIIEGGAGGNTGVLIGDHSVTVVDAKGTPDSAKQMLAEIKKLTPKPVKMVILTHSDSDHVNGLAAFPDDVLVIADQNNKKEQEAALSAGGPGAPPADYLPNQVTTGERTTLDLDGVNVTLIHVGPAHTSGDLAVYLADDKILFAGDVILSNRPEPLIHLEKNGSSEGLIQFVKALVALDTQAIVPGHGDPTTKAEVEKKLEAWEQKRETIKALVAEGKSLDDIKKALGEAGTPAPTSGPRFPSFTEVVYQELTKK